VIKPASSACGGGAKEEREGDSPIGTLHAAKPTMVAV
jgi:hypothetical protein